MRRAPAPRAGSWRRRHRSERQPRPPVRGSCGGPSLPVRVASAPGSSSHASPGSRPGRSLRVGRPRRSGSRRVHRTVGRRGRADPPAFEPRRSRIAEFESRPGHFGADATARRASRPERGPAPARDHRVVTELVERCRIVDWVEGRLDFDGGAVRSRRRPANAVCGAVIASAATSTAWRGSLRRRRPATITTPASPVIPAIPPTTIGTTGRTDGRPSSPSGPRPLSLPPPAPLPDPPPSAPPRATGGRPVGEADGSEPPGSEGADGDVEPPPAGPVCAVGAVVEPGGAGRFRRCVGVVSLLVWGRRCCRRWRDLGCGRRRRWRASAGRWRRRRLWGWRRGLGWWGSASVWVSVSVSGWWWSPVTVTLAGLPVVGRHRHGAGCNPGSIRPSCRLEGPSWLSCRHAGTPEAGRPEGEVERSDASDIDDC